MPPSVVGGWSGQIFMLGQPVRISLIITVDGAVRGGLADESLTDLKNVSFGPSHIYGELAANHDIADASLGDFSLDIDLALKDGQLMGAASRSYRPGEKVTSSHIGFSSPVRSYDRESLAVPDVFGCRS